MSDIKDAIRIVDKGEICLVEWDLPGEKVNKLSSPVMERLRDVVDELAESSYKAAIFVSRKEKIYIAGADIEEIQKLNTKEAYMNAVTQAHEILNTLEDLPMLTVAAINGACLGGGCEFALACDYRLGSDDKSTKIGLPEVQLGIIPGFGGCIRLPKLVGLAASLDIILAGKSVNAKKAKKIGLISEAVPKELLEQRAIDFVTEKIARGGKKPSKTFEAKSMMDGFLNSFMGRSVVFKQARKTVLKQSKGFYPAPIKAIEVVQKTYGSSNRERCVLVEAESFCDVALTDVSGHLVNLFFALEDVKKQTGVKDKNIKAKNVDYMAVLGAGVMGGGIAYQGAAKGVDVRMKDITTDAIAKGLKAARDILGKKLKRRRISKFELANVMNRISGGTDYSGFKHQDVVIEAIVEDMNIKKAVIKETAEHCKADCIIATNTSSLSVNEMAKAHPHPENFVGMHFFNPVDKMPLVEVIRGEHTSDEATATIFALSKKMGKTPVVVKDGPGFLVNRLLLPLLSEALFLLEEGCDIVKVDRFYTHQFGMPMGPFRLMDEVGLDTCIKVLKIFRESLGERIEISKLSEKLSSTDRLGCKNRKGFYLYDERGKQLEVDQSVYAELGLPTPQHKLSSKECVERGMLQMINEASRALYEDRIVETPQEVDVAMIMGTGFPPFRGGLLKYADNLGIEYIIQELEEYSTKLGIRFKPAQSLLQLKSFYK